MASGGVPLMMPHRVVALSVCPNVHLVMLCCQAVWLSCSRFRLVVWAMVLLAQWQFCFSFHLLFLFFVFLDRVSSDCVISDVWLRANWESAMVPLIHDKWTCLMYFFGNKAVLIFVGLCSICLQAIFLRHIIVSAPSLGVNLHFPCIMSVISCI